MSEQAMSGGFANSPVESANAFRAALNVMARPGTTETVGGASAPAPVSVAAAVLLLTLCDAETPVFVAPSHASPEFAAWLAFHTGAPIVTPDRAVFAIGDWDSLSPFDPYMIGTPEYPDRSATLIVDGDMGLFAQKAILSGPGIRDTAEIALPDLAAFQANRSLFPLGLDFYFTQGNALRAMPRSSKVEAA